MWLLTLVIQGPIVVLPLPLEWAYLASMWRGRVGVGSTSRSLKSKPERDCTETAAGAPIIITSSSIATCHSGQPPASAKRPEMLLVVDAVPRTNVRPRETSVDNKRTHTRTPTGTGGDKGPEQGCLGSATPPHRPEGVPPLPRVGSQVQTLL